MARVLILGGDSILGKMLTAHLSYGHIVSSSSRKNGSELYIDALKFEECKIDYANYDFIVNLIAISKFSECEKEPDKAKLVNIDFPLKVLNCLREGATRFLQISTSAVFSCDTPCQELESPKIPTSVYGQQKLDLELALLEAGVAEILRITKVIHPNDLLGQKLKCIKSGEYVNIFSDLYFCPISLDCFLQGVRTILNQGSELVYQLSGDRDISYADALKHIVFNLGLDISKVISVGCDNYITPTNILRYTSMQTSKIFLEPDRFVLDTHKQLEICYV